MSKTTIITKTTEDGAAEALPQYKGPFWEVIANIANLGADAWQQHKARVYRATEQWTNDVAPEGNSFQEAFDEDTIRNKWGGGRYLIWLYGPPDARKVVCQPYKLTLAGAPKANGFNGNGHASSDIVAVLNVLVEELRSARGGNTTEQAMKSALDLQAQALKSGVTAVRELNPAPAAPPEKSSLEKALDKLMELTIMRMMDNKPDPLQEALQKAMIDRLINPTNPIDQVKQIVEGIKPLLGGFGGGKTDLGQLANTFITTLPNLGEKVVQTAKEYRLASESNERAIRLQSNHGLNKGDVIDVPPTSASSQEPAADNRPADPSNNSPASAAPQVSPVEDVHGPSIEWVQLKIVEAIEKNPQAAGEWLYGWLDAIAPELNQQLGPMTAAQIEDIFRTQPILSKVAKHPELPKIIQAYLADAKEASAAKPS